MDDNAFHTIFHELAVDDTPGFSEYLRIPYSTFVERVELIIPKIAKHNTIMTDAISPSERFAICIRYLAIGETFRSLSYWKNNYI